MKIRPKSNADNAIPFGRMMSNETARIKAEEIIDILKIWGIGKSDAYYICREMTAICKDTPNENWKNPLEGTGLTADKIFEKSN